jgi:glycosyltransferase involved in cell wall biosynthesis
MKDALNILAPTRYPWRFNSPRQSKHSISNRNFLPLNYIHSSIEGVTVLNPLPLRKFDLIHAFNRIPVGVSPFVIGFESHLPRAFGREEGQLFAVLSRMLTGKRCRKIVAISQFARRQLFCQHDGKPWFDSIASKVTVRYPNILVPQEPDSLAASQNEAVRLVFVGNHFVRKGGLVALRLAQIANQEGFQLKVDIISALQAGGKSWVGPTRQGFFSEYYRLLDTLPNVTQHGSLPNAAVLDLIGRSHFLLLPTFADSFGYSAIEAMARYTPVIATSQGALPEFVEDEVNGILLSLDTDEMGVWKHSGRTDRHLPAYEAMFHDEVERLADQLFKKLQACMQTRSIYTGMRAKARSTAEALFASGDAQMFWDDLYREAVCSRRFEGLTASVSL